MDFGVCHTHCWPAGYGDVAPRSMAGRLLAGISMMMGIMMIALPITVISNNFSCVYQERARAKMCKKERFQRSHSREMLAFGDAC
jgi:uncharacterized membrane protein